MKEKEEVLAEEKKDQMCLMLCLCVSDAGISSNKTKFF